MKKVHNASIALAIHAAVFLMLYLWKVEGIAGAGNVIAGYSALLFLATVGIAACHDDKAPVQPAALPFGIGRLLFAGEAGVLLWFGHWGMVLCFLFAWLMRAGSDKKRREYHAAQAAGV